MAKNRQEFNASWRAEAQQTLKDAGYKESENVKAFKQYNQSKVEHFKTAHDFYKPYLNARNLAHQYNLLNQRTQNVVDSYTQTTRGPRGETQRSAKLAARRAENAAGIAGRTTTAETTTPKSAAASAPRGGAARGNRKSDTSTNTSGVGLWGLTGASAAAKPAEETAPEEVTTEEVTTEKKKPKEEKNRDNLKSIYNDAQNYLMLLDTMELPAEERAALHDAFSDLCTNLEKERIALLDEADYFRSEEARAAFTEKYDTRVRDNVKMSDSEYAEKKAREEKYSAYTTTADELYLASPQEAVDYLNGMLTQKESELEAANAEVAAAQKLDADSPSGNNNSALMLAMRKQTQLAEEVRQLEWMTSTYESKRLYDVGKHTWEPNWAKLNLTGRSEHLADLNSRILDAQAAGDAAALRSLQEEWDWYETFGGEDAAVIIRQLTYENNLAEIERLDAAIASLEAARSKKMASGELVAGEYVGPDVSLLDTRISDLEYRKGQLVQANTIYLRTEYENDSRYALRYNDDFEVVSSGGNFVNPSIEELEAYGRAKEYSDAEIGAILTNGGSYGKDGNLYDAAGNLVASTTVDQKTGAISHSSDPNAPIITDKLGMFLSARDETTGRMIVDEKQLEKAQQIVANGESNLWADFMVESDAKSWSELTDAEIATYYYIYRKESREAAYEYLDALTPLLNKRETEKHLGRVYEAKGFERLYYNVASVPQNILGGVAAFAEDTIRMASGNDVNPYSRLHLAQTIAQATRQTTGEIIDNFTAGQPLTRDELTQLWKGEYDGVLPEGTRNRVLGISLGDAYQAGMSGLDSMFGAFVLGAGAYGALMGMGAASTTAKNYYEKGASRDQILTMSLVAGTAEMLFEKWSVEQLLKRSASDGLVKNFLRQGLAEGSEEINTEIANIITDALVMGEQSDWTTAIHRYGMEGYTPAQASAMALMDIVEQVWKAGVSGFISGGMSSSVYTIAQQLDNKRQQHDLNIAWFCPPDTTANQLAQEIFKQRNNIALRLSAGETIGPGEYSSLQAKQIELAKAIKNLDSDVKAEAEAEALKFEESQTAEEKKAVLRGQGAARLADEAAKRGLDLEAVSAEEADVAIAAEAEAAQPAATAEAPAHTGPIAAAVESAKVNKTGKPVGDLVTAIMHDPASMAELNIPVTGPTNTQKRTAIIAKIKDIIAQESLDTNSAAVDNKGNTEPAAREKAPEKAPVSMDGIPQFEEFSADLRAKSEKFAALTDKQMRDYYNSLVDAELSRRREAAAEKEAVEATAGKWVFIEETGEWLSYSRFADAVRQQLSKSGKTLDAKSARGTFEVAYASQAELRANNLKEVEAAANSINTAFKTAGVKLGVRVSSGKGEFSYRKGITEGAFYDPKTHEIVFNGDAIHAADILYYTLAHEVIHPAAKADPTIVESVLKTFQQLRDNGYKFNAKTARILADLDTEMAVLLDRYQRHAGARKKITRAYVEEELAGNLLREVYAELDLMKEFAKVDAAPLRKSHDWVKRIRNTLSGKKSKTAAEDNAAFKDILDTLNHNLTEALKKADTLREKAENGTLSTADAKGGNYDITDEVKAAMTQETQEVKDSEELSYMLTELDVTVNTPWWQQVDNRLSANPRNALYIPETSNILAEVGLPDLPLCMTVRHLNDAMHEESPNNPMWHGISEDIMKKLPELLAKPVMILDSWTTPGDIVVVTSAIDSENRPVVVPIHPNGEAVVDGVKGPANFITTVYGRANFAPKPRQTSAYNFMYLALRNRAILYWNKERSETLRQALGVQFPSGLSKVRSDEIIREYRGYVKGQAQQRRFMLSEEVEYGEDSSELFPTDVHERGRLAGLDAQSRGAQVYGLDGRTRQEENRGRVPASDRTAGSRNSAGTSRVAAGAAEYGQDVSRTAQRDDGSQTTYGQANAAYRGRTNPVLRPDGAEAYAPRGGVQSKASEDGRRSETPARDRMAGVLGEESTRKTGDRAESPATRTAGARSVVLRDLGASSEVEAQEDPFDFESLNDKIQTWSDAGSYVKDNIRSDDIVFDVEPDHLPPWETEVTLIVYQQTGQKDIVYSRDAAGLRKLRRDLPKLMAKAGYLDSKVWRDGNPQSTEITDNLKTEVHDLLPADETGSAIWEAEQKELDRVGVTLYATRNEVLFEHAAGLTRIPEKRVIAGYGRAVLQHERLHAYMETDKKLYFQIRDAVMSDKRLAGILKTERETVLHTWQDEYATPLAELHQTEMEVFAEAFANNVALLGRNIRQLAPIVRREVNRWIRAWDADTRSVQEKKYSPDLSELQEEYGKRGVDTSEDEALFAGIEDGLYYSLEEDYENALAQNDLSAAQQAVIKYAASKGYDTLGFHGTDSAGFTVVANGYWLWFARDREVAQEYGNYFPGKNVNPKAPHDADGVYSMAYRLGNNLRIDADGDSWAALPVNPYDYPGVYMDDETGDVSTNALAEWAEENGYDSITFENVDDGGLTTVDVIFNPRSDAKSVDPITYDDNGNAIPLPERFDETNNDLRYALDDVYGGTDELIDRAFAYKWVDLNRAYYAAAQKGDTERARSLLDMAATRLGYPVRDGDFYKRDPAHREALAAYGPQQISAELIVWDEDGHVSPPGVRYKEVEIALDRIFNAGASAIDRAYFDALDRDDALFVQVLVDKAARRAGFVTPLYHGTDAEFNVFRRGEIGIHAGTWAQARDRLLDTDRILNPKSRILRLYAHSGPSLPMAEDIGYWRGSELASTILRTGEYHMLVLGPNVTREEIIDELEEIANMQGVDSDAAIRQLLRDTGWNCIKYDNTVEGVRANGGVAGNTSYIIFDPNEVKSAEPVTYDGDGIVPLSERFNLQSDDFRYALDEDIGESKTQYAPTFYSQLYRVVDAMKGDKIGLVSLTDKALLNKGVRAEEIRWSGIRDFVTRAEADGRKSVRKDELLSLIKQSTPRFDETTFHEANEHLRWSMYSAPEGTNKRDVLIQVPGESYSNEAMALHWGENQTGVLAHMRLQDFETPSGTMLFADEVQSDWHNAGHKNGYFDPRETTIEEIVAAKTQAIRDEFLTSESGRAIIAEYRGWMDELESLGFAEGLDGRQSSDTAIFDWLVDQGNNGNVDPLMSEGFDINYSRERILSALNKKLEAVENKRSAPNAPFSETYPEFAAKRLLREAAEGGYTAIGWTPSEVQMSRWNPKYKTNAEMDVEDAKDPNAIAFLGAYRNVYDSALRRALDKFGKKFGEKVSRTKLPVELDMENADVSEGSSTYTLTYNGARTHFMVWREDLAYLGLDPYSANDAFSVLWDEFTKTYGETTFWSMPFTEEMRQSVLYEGQPLYYLDEDDASPGQDDGVFSLFANAYKTYAETAKKERQNVVTAADIGSTAQKDAPIGMALYSSNPAITEEDFFEMAQVFQRLMDTYGVINKPVGAVRNDSTPRRTAPENKVSETVATVLGAAATPDSRVPTIMQMVVEDKVSYSPKTNAASIRAARSKLTQMGFQNARVDWSTRVHNNETSAEMVAMGAILLNNAGNSNATGEEYVSILMDYAYLLRNSSQATQAAQILKRLTPEGKLYAVQKTVDKINDQQKKRRRPGKKTRRGKAGPKNGQGRTRRDGTGKKSGDLDHGLPVDEWMDKVGEELAKSITNKLSASPEKAKTVSQTILGDLKKFAEQTLPTQNKKMAKRTSMDRLRDLFENKDHYEKAWAMAKKKMREEFGASKETMAAINDWMNQSLDFAALLTEELTDYQDVRVDPRLAEAYLKAETDRRRDEILELICKNIAAQVKATGAEKFNALRYTAMLGNLKTQVRNMAGNIAMQPVRIASTSVQGILEALLQLTGVRIERTTSVLHDWGTFKYARQEYEKVRHAILGGKHTVEINDEIRSMIEENRSIWKFNVRGVNIHPLELWRLATDKMMNGGDALFCSFTFADALSRYMKANRTTWAKASDELKDKAREYAIREAAEATFRDNNQFAIMIARAARAKDATTAERAKAAVAEGIQPFRKTPANVLVRALEYSPVGLVYTAVNAIRVARGSENVTGTDIIRSLSKTLTGSGLVYLGAALAALGLLRGRAPEEEDEAAFEEMLGHQEYSIELDGNSYTLDWLAPVCIPVFLGANLQQMALENGLTLAEFGKALSGLTDPILKMSMLQGVNDTLENAATYGDDSALTRFTGNALWGFVTQAVPTLLGQAERASTNTRMMTYVDKNNEAVPDGIQRLLGKLSAKIPGWDYAQFVYTDAWGRMEQNAETETWNIISQFLSPGYAATIEETDMEEELLRLYRATGDSSVLIQNASKYFTVDGVRKDLTGDEYVSFNTTRGQTAFAIMTALVASEAYKQMDDKSKAKAVSSVYNFATQSAKLELTNGEYAADSWVVKAIDAAYEVGLPVQTVVTYKTALSVLEDTFPDGVNYEGEDMAVKTFVGMQIAQDSSLNDEQRNALGPILIAGGRWIPDDTVTDYSSIDSYKMSQQSASAQTKFEHLPSQFSMDVDMFTDAYEICNQKGVSAPAKKTQLAELLGNEEDANDFYAYLQRETITEDKVSHLPENVGAELVRLSQSDVGYNYTIAPPDSTPAASYKDPSSKSGRSAATREWVLTAEQYDEYISMRDELYISKMEALLRSSAYKTASDSKKCELIVELKEEVSDEHYDNFIDWLSRNAKSTPVK